MADAVPSPDGAASVRPADEGCETARVETQLTATDTAGAMRSPRPALRPARTVARWTVRHGLPAVVLERGARRGDPVGRLLRNRSVRDEPYALYEEVRARGPVSPGSLGPVTPSRAVASEILRSDHFGVAWD